MLQQLVVLNRRPQKVLIGREVRPVNSKDLLVLQKPSSVRNPTARSPQSNMDPQFTLGLFGLYQIPHSGSNGQGFHESPVYSKHDFSISKSMEETRKQFRKKKSVPLCTPPNVIRSCEELFSGRSAPQ